MSRQRAAGLSERSASDPSAGQDGAPIGTASPDCLSDEALEALALGSSWPPPGVALSREQALAHAGTCARCTRELALIAREAEPMSAQRHDQILRYAQSQVPELERRRASAVTPWWKRLSQGLAGWGMAPRLGLALALVLAVMIPLLRPGSGTRLEDAPPRAYSVLISGEQSSTQGSAPAPGSTEGQVPLFTGDSELNILMTAQDISPELSAQLPHSTLRLWVARPDQTLARLEAGREYQLDTGESGFLIRGFGRDWFGASEGNARVLLIVVPDAALGDLPTANSIAETEAALTRGAQAGKWWWSAHPVRFQPSAAKAPLP